MAAQMLRPVLRGGPAEAAPETDALPPAEGEGSKEASQKTEHSELRNAPPARRFPGYGGEVLSARLSPSRRDDPRRKKAAHGAAFSKFALGARQISLPMATAVSLMRFEKPHSLSYQVRMRTMVPSITLVWSMWNTEEWLSWLKSEETSFSVV